MSENITPTDINKRINRIEQIERDNTFNINFNEFTHPGI